MRCSLPRQGSAIFYASVPKALVICQLPTITLPATLSLIIKDLGQPGESVRSRTWSRPDNTQCRRDTYTKGTTAAVCMASTGISTAQNFPKASGFKHGIVCVAVRHLR